MSVVSPMDHYMYIHNDESGIKNWIELKKLNNSSIGQLHQCKWNLVKVYRCLLISNQHRCIKVWYAFDTLDREEPTDWSTNYVHPQN